MRTNAILRNLIFFSLTPLIGCGSNNPSYEQALLDESDRPDYITSLVENPVQYAIIEYTTPEVLEELKQKYNYVPPSTFRYATSLTQNMTMVGNQSSFTRVIVYPLIFHANLKADPASWKDAQIIIRGIINHHELLHADHYHHGIPEFDTHLFFDKTGSINMHLFSDISELLAYRNEWVYLQTKKGTSNFYDGYKGELDDLALRHYKNLYEPSIVGNMDPAFVSRLLETLDPRKWPLRRN